ncbi:hypothetical protein KRR40_12490 [Niabella defluvii]|nr:hypothetical protein KRR40_12490 [Niabella sp. I65]
MEKLQIEKSKLVDAYNNTATHRTRYVLETLFGKEIFIQPGSDIISRIKTLEDACNELGIGMDTRHSNCPTAYKKAERDIEIFAEALREGKPAGECYYYPYFNCEDGGFEYEDSSLR